MLRSLEPQQLFIYCCFFFFPNKEGRFKIFPYWINKKRPSCTEMSVFGEPLCVFRQTGMRSRRISVENVHKFSEKRGKKNIRGRDGEVGASQARAVRSEPGRCARLIGRDGSEAFAHVSRMLIFISGRPERGLIFRRSPRTRLLIKS